MIIFVLQILLFRIMYGHYAIIAQNHISELITIQHVIKTTSKVTL